MNIFSQKSVIKSAATLALGLYSALSFADFDDRLVKRGLLDRQGNPTGEVLIIDNPNAPDNFHLSVRNLKPNFRYTVFLGQSQTLGALPVEFVGEFSTDTDGRGTFHAVTEVINAFASANQVLEDANGVADVLAAGALANGANTIPLNWVRIYEASGTISVFGGSEREIGGPLGPVSDVALP